MFSVYVDSIFDRKNPEHIKYLANYILNDLQLNKKEPTLIYQLDLKSLFFNNNQNSIFNHEIKDKEKDKIGNYLYSNENYDTDNGPTIFLIMDNNTSSLFLFLIYKYNSIIFDMQNYYNKDLDKKRINIFKYDNRHFGRDLSIIFLFSESFYINGEKKIHHNIFVSIKMFKKMLKKIDIEKNFSEILLLTEIYNECYYFYKNSLFFSSKDIQNDFNKEFNYINDSNEYYKILVKYYDIDKINGIFLLFSLFSKDKTLIENGLIKDELKKIIVVSPVLISGKIKKKKYINEKKERKIINNIILNKDFQNEIFKKEIIYKEEIKEIPIFNGPIENKKEIKSLIDKKLDIPNIKKNVIIEEEIIIKEPKQSRKKKIDKESVVNINPVIKKKKIINEEEFLNMIQT